MYSFDTLNVRYSTPIREIHFFLSITQPFAGLLHHQFGSILIIFQSRTKKIHPKGIVNADVEILKERIFVIIGWIKNLTFEV